MTVVERTLRRPSQHILLLIGVLVSPGLVRAGLTGELPTVSDPNTPGKRLTVAVLRFEDRTGDPNAAHWRYSTCALLRNQLDEVGQLRLLSDQAVRYAFRKIGLNAGDRVDPNAARRIGEIIEAQRVIWGSYGRNDINWQLEASIVNVATGRLWTLPTVTSSDWFDLTDRLSSQVLTELGIVPSAEEKAKMAERWTTSAAALDFYGRAYASQEHAEPVSQQQQLMRRALAADPNCARALLGLAATLASEGKFGDAEDAARKVLQLDPDWAEAHHVLARLLLTQRQTNEAVELLRQARRLNPDDATYPTMLAQVSIMQGRWEQAIVLLETAASLDRTDADVHASLAYICATQGMVDRALEQVKEVEQIEPEGVAALSAEQMVGQTYEVLEKRPEAITHYERLVEIGKKVRVNPEAISKSERRIERLKAALTPTFVEIPVPVSYTPEALSAAIATRLTETEAELTINPLTSNGPIQCWARELTEKADSDLEKAKAIFDVLAKRRGAQGLPAARTAREVFAVWNDSEVPLLCGDHAVLFIALARAANVNAFFVHVGKDPGGEVVHHACAAVFAEGRALLVDPAWHWFGVPHQEFEVLDDLKTIALFCFVGDQAASKSARCRVGLKLWPSCLFGRLSFVNALRQERQLQQAKALLDEIPTPQADSWNAYFFHSQHGAFALARRDLNQAYQSLQKALSIYPDGDTRFLVGIVFEERGQLQQAREAYRHALRSGLSPETADVVRHRIAQINERIGFEPATVGSGASEAP